MFLFFFSSRRRHTRCALVTGVQTCALPIYMEGQTMRKPRDFDDELQALTDKAKALKTKKQSQLGELVISTGADILSIELPAGALLAAVGADATRQETWRKSGRTFFRGDRARARKGAGHKAPGRGAGRGK